MQSIIGAMGTEEIARMRLGVAPEHISQRGANYLLRQFKKSELPVFDEMLDRAAEAVRVILTEGVAAAMNRFNRRATDEAAAPGRGDE
jgi:PTH1 family peptidyl-tRNA hydrolase